MEPVEAIGILRGEIDPSSVMHRWIAAPIDGGNYRDRFDAAIDAVRGTR